MTSPIFRIKAGLSVYALSCGYFQRIESEITGEDIRVDLWHESGHFHARAHNFTTSTRIDWVTESNLDDARTQWAALVKQIFGNVIRTIKKDKRYTVTREFAGESSPAYVTRFCGEWVSNSDTAPGAWVKAAEHNAERI